MRAETGSTGFARAIDLIDRGVSSKDIGPAGRLLCPPGDMRANEYGFLLFFECARAGASFVEPACVFLSSFSC